ncbi:MAG: restriction endonuclease subunit S [Limisphaerales bacterium]
MDRSRLLQHFGSLAETPDAIQKLRALVLDLAFRGQLVPHASKPDTDPTWLKFRAAIDSTAFAVLHPKPFLNSRFLFHWLRSAPFQADVAAKMKGVAYPAISDSEFWKCLIPVPPLPEQRRIVAKVEELMRWCDDLESRLAAAQTAGTQLLDATLRQMLAA